MPQRGSLARRLLKIAGAAALGLLLLTAIPVLVLRWLHPLTTAFMLEARADAALAGQHGYRQDYRWASLEQISPHAAIAVIASEDQQFPFHAGFDFDSIREAVRASEHGKRLRGASTISQQVAKNLFLWSGHSFVRKGLEAWFTTLLELCWPKSRILEVYLNSAQFGPDVFGVEAAAQTYFHKHAAALTRAEAAQLAAVLPNPLRLHADKPSAYVVGRREWILTQMRALGEYSYLRNLR